MQKQDYILQKLSKLKKENKKMEGTNETK